MNAPIAAPRVIVLMGVSGCGKSTIGRMLADELCFSFVEGDDFHGDDNVAKMRAGIALDDADRRPWLDRIAMAVRNANPERRGVVAACSALKSTYRRQLAAAVGIPALFVFLDVGSSELHRRMEGRTGHFMPVTLLASQLTLLERPTDTEGAIVIDASREPREICETIRQRLASFL